MYLYMSLFQQSTQPDRGNLSQESLSNSLRLQLQDRPISIWKRKKNSGAPLELVITFESPILQLSSVILFISLFFILLSYLSVHFAIVLLYG